MKYKKPDLSIIVGSYADFINKWRQSLENLTWLHEYIYNYPLF